jgi:DinB superfamily
MSTRADTSTTRDRPRCGCCGQPRTALAELGDTPGVFICRWCALGAVRRARALPDPSPVALRTEMQEIDRHALHRELNRACSSFSALVHGSSRADLRRRSAGTRWTNQQLLFHLLFGYLVVLRLLPLVQLLSRLPDVVSRRFAALLDAATGPFHVVNYLGSWAGGSVLTPTQMEALFERTIALLHRRLDATHDADLRRHMHFPVGWDPFVTDVMTLADVYHFGTQHFDFHRQQLTLSAPGAPHR